MKGRTWCIGFQDEAKKDGDVQIKYMVADALGKTQEIKGIWEGYKKGATKLSSRKCPASRAPAEAQTT